MNDNHKDGKRRLSFSFIRSFIHSFIHSFKGDLNKKTDQTAIGVSNRRGALQRGVEETDLPQIVAHRVIGERGRLQRERGGKREADRQHHHQHERQKDGKKKERGREGKMLTSPERARGSSRRSFFVGVELKMRL